jgi:hypothetical protein
VSCSSCFNKDCCHFRGQGGDEQVAYVLLLYKRAQNRRVGLQSLCILYTYCTYFFLASVYMPGLFPHASNSGMPASDLQFSAMLRIDLVGGMIVQRF